MTGRCVSNYYNTAVMTMLSVIWLIDKLSAAIITLLLISVAFNLKMLDCGVKVQRSSCIVDGCIFCNGYCDKQSQAWAAHSI